MDVISLFTTAIGVAGFAGGVVGYFAKSRGDSIIQYQAKELELRDESIARLEKEKTALITERDSLKAENARLVRLAQGSPKLATLIKEVRALTKLLTDREARR